MTGGNSRKKPHDAGMLVYSMAGLWRNEEDTPKGAGES